MVFSNAVVASYIPSIIMFILDIDVLKFILTLCGEEGAQRVTSSIKTLYKNSIQIDLKCLILNFKFSKNAEMLFKMC